MAYSRSVSAHLLVTDLTNASVLTWRGGVIGGMGGEAVK